jgi:hypothetical protein
MSSIKSQTGNTVLMMLVLIAGLSLATIAMFGSAQVYDSSGVRFVARQKALYVSDGTRAFAIQLTQDYLKDNPAADNQHVADYLASAIPPLLPPGYSVSDITVDMSPQGTLIIPNGTFKGMVAPQNLVKFSYTISKGTIGSENQISHHFEAVVTLAQVGLHQFLYFIDLDSAGFSPGPPTTVDGRVHANGDFCIAGGSGSGLVMSKVSAAGRLMLSSRAECGLNQQSSYPLTRTWISTGTSAAGPKAQFGLGLTPTTANDNGCLNCRGSGQNWTDYALQHWNGNAQDREHGVPKLSLPLPDNIQAQLGANGPNTFVAYSNSKNLRFLVDPVLPSDSDTVRKMKYSYASDVRIIDGVWYLRDRNNPALWPGKPIWSDHPGNFTVGGQSVGQGDLKGILSWTTVPRRYSYYDFDSTLNKLGESGLGTLSYGNLARTTTSGVRWYPGQLLNPTSVNRPAVTPTLFSGSENLCPTTNPVGTTYGSLSPALGAKTVALWSTSLTCGGGGISPTPSTALINATRSGINDPHVAWYSKIVYDNYTQPSVIPNDRSRILPVNFDIEHFQAALADTTAGEFGSYFTHNGSKTDFNGIVYITTTWPGSMDGFSPRGIPAPWPVQNDGGFTDDIASNGTPARTGDINQIRMTGDEQQRSLPFQLCSQSYANRGFDTGLTGYHFQIADCARYATSSSPGATDLTAFPNAIRIHNGATVDMTAFPKGLSIVSNVPVYILGDYNTNSVTTSATATPWIPTLVAGDQITLLSNNWDDKRDAFAVWQRGAVTSRPASTTTYNVSLISGWAMHRNENLTAPFGTTNEALHSMPALMEDWASGGSALNLNGSIAIGYYPVYYRGGRYYWNSFSDPTVTKSSYNYATYSASTKNIKYDSHLEQISNQPPGSPTFYTSSTQSWKIK